MQMVTPATRFDLAETRPLTVPQMTALRAYLDVGPSWALRDDVGRCLVVGGLLPVDDVSRGAWIVLGSRAARHMRLIVQLARTLLDTETAGDPRVILLEIESVAGARLARLVGFRPTKHQYQQRRIWQWLPFSKAATAAPRLPAGRPKKTNASRSATQPRKARKRTVKA